MTELFHITERAAWAAASTTGEYRISTRDVTLAEHDLVVLVIDSDRRSDDLAG